MRRYLLSRTPNPTTDVASACTTPYSFGWQLVYRYLTATGVEVGVRDREWMFGSVVAKRLRPRSGGYQRLDARGNQLLLNYRNLADSHPIASQLTVREVLEGGAGFTREAVADRVVLIGRTDSPDRDWYVTPHGRMQGVFVHAHLISQLLSAVEDGRPLIWVLPGWGDGLVVLLCGALGGASFAVLKGVPSQLLGVGMAVLVVYGGCWWGLLKGGWLPLVPAALGLVGTGVSVVGYGVYRRQTDE